MTIQVKYNKPKILLIDCDKKVAYKLAEEGFNIQAGSFGSICSRVYMGVI